MVGVFFLSGRARSGRTLTPAISTTLPRSPRGHQPKKQQIVTATYDSKEIPDRYVFRADSPCGPVLYDTGFTGEWGRGCRASAPCCNATKYSNGGPGCLGDDSVNGPYCPPSFDGISPAAPPGGPGVGETPPIQLPLGGNGKLYATAYGVCGGTLNRLTLNC